jgi:hypothetical protein
MPISGNLCRGALFRLHHVLDDSMSRRSGEERFRELSGEIDVSEEPVSQRHAIADARFNGLL